jgi:hypothetical protein
VFTIGPPVSVGGGGGLESEGKGQPSWSGREVCEVEAQRQKRITLSRLFVLLSGFLTLNQSRRRVWPVHSYTRVGTRNTENKQAETQSGRMQKEGQKTVGSVRQVRWNSG